MRAFETLRMVPLFADLAEDDLARLCAASREDRLPAGTTLFEEGDHGDAAYVITDGSIEILKQTGPQEVLLALRYPGEVIGEMALLRDEPRMASARVRDDATVLVIPRPALADVLDTSPGAVRALFNILLERLRSTEALLQQTQRMAQLGTLTAGLAHELNNPAAAVARAADQLRAAVQAHVEAHGRAAAALGHDPTAAVASVTGRRPPTGAALDALARADREQALEVALDALGVPEPWTLAPELAEAGLEVDDLAELREAFDPATLPAVLAAVSAGATVEALLGTVVSGTARLSSIVTSLKSYAFLDQAPVQDLDLSRCIEDTLLLLGPKLADLDVVRTYPPDLPRIAGNGPELNQVWTHLLDNAADAIAERRRQEGDGAAGRIEVAVTLGDGAIVVAVSDDGAGIPAAIRDRIFDAFFTTKPPGQGVGLGLDVSSRIVSAHGGQLTAESAPGRTTFTAILPIP